MSHTILLVDDDPQLSHVVSMFFEIEGYVVLVAKDGMKALEMLGETLPDIVLCDLNMPDMDGAEVCRRIRSNPKAKDIPIVIFTAFELREEELVEAGANQFIVKPYSLNGLGKDVRGLIQAAAASKG
ncbi:MAG: response regulator [Candidatus Dormibacteria bacterium]